MQQKETLFALLKFHDEAHRKVDEELANICRNDIQSFLDNFEFQKAKNYVYEFYKDFTDFTFEKDCILYSINNQKIKYENNLEK